MAVKGVGPTVVARLAQMGIDRLRKPAGKPESTIDRTIVTISAAAKN